MAVSSVAPVPKAGEAATTPAAAPAAPTSRANESVRALIFSGRIWPGWAAARLTAASHRLLDTSSIVPSMPAANRSNSAASTRAANLAAQRPARSAYVTDPVLARRGGTLAPMAHVDGHAGHQTIVALGRFGIDVMFTLNGGHVWPFYEAAAKREMCIVDTRHEAAATFAAEAYAKLTRKPGLAVLTAGPGVTNGVSAVTSAHFNGSPVVVLGGRAPARRWGVGSLQELDQPPILAPITKLATMVA